MGKSGGPGPTRGAYSCLQFSTPSIGAVTGNQGTEKQVLWMYTIPDGMDIVVVDCQLYCGAIGTNSRVNLLAGGASILRNGTNSETAQGVGLTSLRSVPATISTGVFGAASTSIIAPTTPSGATRDFGAYIVGGATLCATMSNGATATSQVMGTILFYPAAHPSVIPG